MQPLLFNAGLLHRFSKAPVWCHSPPRWFWSFFDTPILNKPPTADGSPAIIKLKSWVRKCKTHGVMCFFLGSFEKQTADGESQQCRGKQKELGRVQLKGNRLYQALVSRTEPCVMIMNDILLENTEQTQTQPTSLNTYTWIVSNSVEGVKGFLFTF